jgi:hypothetical protein
MGPRGHRIRNEASRTGTEKGSWRGFRTGGATSSTNALLWRDFGLDSVVMRRLLALILLLAPAAHAETYKWVDERGVVNYSNTPPPAAAKAAAKAIPERVSTYEPDPSMQRVAYAPPPLTK